MKGYACSSYSCKVKGVFRFKLDLFMILHHVDSTCIVNKPISICFHACLRYLITCNRTELKLVHACTHLPL